MSLPPPAPPGVLGNGRPAQKPERRRARLPFGLLAFALLTAIFGLPTLLCAALVAAAAPYGWPLLAPTLLALPLIGTTLFVLTAGLLSRPHHHAIRPGRFQRDLADPTYRARRLYGLCWTSVYYATPLYFLVLSLPWLKRLTFRLFGYRGQMQFTVYPDTWIRDLPLLDFGPGAYVSNKATLGTNVAQANGSLLVDRISVGAGALVGHLAMLSTGTVLEEGAEVGVGCAVGSKVRFRRNAAVAACCAVGHLADLGEDVRVGYMSSIGIAARIDAGLRLPQVAIVPNRCRVANQADVDALISSSQSPVARLARSLAQHAPASPAVYAPPAVADADPVAAATWNRFE